MKIKKSHRGFTLIELMIVIVILGILMTTILPRLAGARARARDTGRLADLRTIATALELYKDDFGRLPGEFSDPVVNTDRICLRQSETSGQGGQNFKLDVDALRDVFPNYFKGGKVPQPPNKETTYFGGLTLRCERGYLYLPLKKKSSDTIPTAYALIANIENPGKGNAIQKVTGITYTITIPPEAVYDYSDDPTLEGVSNALKATTPQLLLDIEQDDPTGYSTSYVLLGE